MNQTSAPGAKLPPSSWVKPFGGSTQLSAKDQARDGVGGGYIVAGAFDAPLRPREIDRGRIHALTGPIFVEGAEPGDVLQVEVLEVHAQGLGLVERDCGAGILKERFSGPFCFTGSLRAEVSRSLAPAVVPLRPFCGVMGVAHAEDGEFRTRPPEILAATWMCGSCAAGRRCICRC